MIKLKTTYIPKYFKKLYFPTLRNGKLGLVRDELALEFNTYLKNLCKANKIVKNTNKELTLKIDVFCPKNRQLDLITLTTMITTSIKDVAIIDSKYITSLEVKRFECDTEYLYITIN